MKQASHQSRYLNWTLNNAKKFGGTFVTCTEVIYKGFLESRKFASMETRLHNLLISFNHVNEITPNSL